MKWWWKENFRIHWRISSLVWLVSSFVFLFSFSSSHRNIQVAIGQNGLVNVFSRTQNRQFNLFLCFWSLVVFSFLFTGGANVVKTFVFLVIVVIVDVVVVVLVWLSFSKPWNYNCLSILSALLSISFAFHCSFLYTNSILWTI